MTEGGIQKRVRHGNVDGFQLTQFFFYELSTPETRNECLFSAFGFLLF